MDIGETVLALESGARMRRKGWYGWLTLNAGDIIVQDDQGRFELWRCPQTDLLAKDWERVE